MTDEQPAVRVYANGDWHPMPMSTADAARLIRERDEARAEVERLREELEAMTNAWESAMDDRCMHD